MTWTKTVSTDGPPNPPDQFSDRCRTRVRSVRARETQFWDFV